MLNRWLENEPKETLICAVASAVSLQPDEEGAAPEGYRFRELREYE